MRFHPAPAEVTSPAAAASLLQSMGYRTNTSEVSLPALASIGIAAAPGLRRLTHLATHQNCYFYFADAADRRTARETAARLDGINAVARVVLIARSGDCVDLFARSGSSHRRISLSDAKGGEVSRTLELLAADGRQPLDLTIEKLFDPAETGRRFFTRFRDGVQSLRRYLETSLRDAQPELLDDVPLLLLSRVLFLSFVEEKGWLDGDRAYLESRSRETAQRGGEVFRDFFVPLFFGCLNTSTRRRFVGARSLGRIPYLNGGLFEPGRWERERGPFSIPNEVWCAVLESVFTGVSFTSSEEDGAVHDVDPEMLGRVFESLMQSEERLRSGSFYTPRNVVDKVVRAGLESTLPELWNKDGEFAAHEVPEARRLLSLLENLKILDPACGSGAFLLGALRFVEEAHRELSSQAERPIPAFLRRRIVEKNLFGVDVKREAVRLCELRLWLAIVGGVECEIEQVPPLPNLDRNVMQGNSLVEPLDLASTGSREVYRKSAGEIRRHSEQIERYRNATSEDRARLLPEIIDADRRIADAILNAELCTLTREREALGAQTKRLFGQSTAEVDFRKIDEKIEEHRQRIARVASGNLDFFAYDIHFAGVMRDGGFDLVVGNPPWVRRQRIEPSLRIALDRRYRSFGSSGFDQTDLSVAFVERAILLSKQRGTISMLLPAKLATARYAIALRRLIAQECSIRRVQDFSRSARRMFEADTFPLALTLLRATEEPEDLVQLSREESQFEFRSSALRLGDGSRWFLGPPSIGAISQRLTKAFPTLRESLGREPLMGIKTGANSRFFFPELHLRKEYASPPGTAIRIPYANLVRAVRGRDVEEFRAKDSCWMLLPPRQVPRVSSPQWLIRLAELLETPPETLQLSYLRPEHLGLKVAWKDLSRGLRAAVVRESVEIEGRSVPLVPNQTLYFLDCSSEDEAHALAAFLNSRLVRALALVGAEPAKDDHQRYYGSHVALLPLPPLKLGGDEWAQLTALGQRAPLAIDRDAIDSVIRDLLHISTREAAKLIEFAQPILRS